MCGDVGGLHSEPSQGEKNWPSGCAGGQTNASGETGGVETSSGQRPDEPGVKKGSDFMS